MKINLEETNGVLNEVEGLIVEAKGRSRFALWPVDIHANALDPRSQRKGDPSVVGSVAKLNQWAKKRELVFKKDPKAIFGGYYVDPKTGESWEADIVNAFGKYEDVGLRNKALIHERYSRDPYLMKSKYAGIDANGRAFKKGEEVMFYPIGKKIVSGPEKDKAWREFQAAREDERFMGGGM